MFMTPKRGDIFHVEIPHATGHEMEKGRPGIIISCDPLNVGSPVVSVVMCSASPKNLAETRNVVINSLFLVSADKSRLVTYLGRCTHEEMDAVNYKCQLALGLHDMALQATQEDEQSREDTNSHDRINEAVKAVETAAAVEMDNICLKAKMEVYQGMYTDLLERLTAGKAGA